LRLLCAAASSPGNRDDQTKPMIDLYGDIPPIMEVIESE
jgi:hypothetical protein